MPTIAPVNTQQVLSMGTHAEKLQQTVQNQPNLLASHLDAERRAADELKRSGVQNPEETSRSIEARAEGRGGRPRQREFDSVQEEPGEAPEHKLPAWPESGRGQRVDLTV